MNQIIIDEIANTFARVNINIVVSNKKILLQIKDAKQRDVVQKELETIFGSDCPFGIITSPLEAGSIQSSSDYNADDLFNTLKNYDGIRCSMSGISSKGFGAEKKKTLFLTWDMTLENYLRINVIKNSEQIFKFSKGLIYMKMKESQKNLQQKKTDKDKQPKKKWG